MQVGRSDGIKPRYSDRRAPFTDPDQTASAPHDKAGSRPIYWLQSKRKNGSAKQLLGTEDQPLRQRQEQMYATHMRMIDIEIVRI